MKLVNGKLLAISFAVLVGGVLGGCSTQPIATSAATPVPQKRVIDAAFLNSAPATGEVIVKRDSGFNGAGCNTRLFVNSKPVADIGVSEKVGIFLPEGDHILSIYPVAPCGGGLVETRATIKAGGSYVFRVGFGNNYQLGIYPTAF